MRYHSLIPLTAALANLVIGGLVLRQGIREHLHRVFAWFTLVVACWNLDIFALYYFTDAASAEWWSRVFRTGICLAPAAGFQLTLLLVGSSGRLWRGLLVTGYVAGALLAIANMDGLLVAGVVPHVWGWYIQPTRLYSLMTIMLVVYPSLCVERIWKAYRQPTSPRQRVHAKFLFLAATVQVPLVVTNLLPAYGINIYPLGNFGNVLFSAILAYAIARHRLMDVDYVVRKGVSFALAAGGVLVPGAVIIGVLSRSMGADEPQLVACAALGLALIAVLLVPTLQRAIETRVHRAFFPTLHDHRRRLNELASALVHLLDEAKLTQQLGAGLMDILDLEDCQVFVQDEQTRRLMLVTPAPAAPEALDERVVVGFEHATEAVLATELDRDPAAAACFREHGWEVGIPLRINDRLTGFVSLGRKRDFRIFSAEDLRQLSTIGSAASVALENARLSRELRRSELVLERANRLSSLGTLAAGIAHEIRNPLVAVKTFLDLLPQRIDDPQFLSEFRELSLSELRRVTDLIADLLTLGKSTVTERRLVDLTSTLEPVVRLMDSTARKRQVELVMHTDPALPPVMADPDQLKQIVLNLLLNAIDVSTAGTQVTLVLGAMAPGIVLEVHDQGPGIPPDQLANLFHPFFTTKETGTGLGLALAHQMVVEHGGEITVDSIVGQGTTFRITLPAAETLQQTGT